MPFRSASPFGKSRRGELVLALDRPPLETLDAAGPGMLPAGWRGMHEHLRRTTHGLPERAWPAEEEASE